MAAGTGLCGAQLACCNFDSKRNGTARQLLRPRLPPISAFQQRLPSHRSERCRRSGSCYATSAGSSGTHQSQDIGGTRPVNEDPLQRRLRESRQVEERVINIYDKEDFEREMKKAGRGLVVLEVESHEVCQSGLPEEPEMQWKEDQQAALAPCRDIKHVFARTARDCPDVTFLALEADAEEAGPLLEELGVEVLPTVHFYKDSQLLWEHRGIIALQQDLGEGVLYYGDAAADGVKPSTFVQDLTTQEQLDSFINSQPSNILTVVGVSLMSATPCIHIFPAVMALAKNMQGYAAFARLIGDASPEMQPTMQHLNIKEVPTFIFYRAGKEVGRFVGSGRGDLIGHILQLQNAMGIAPPPVQRPPRKVLERRQKKKVNPWR